MCRSCVVEDSYCICGTFRQPLPEGQHCGCESGDYCQWCGHSSTGGPSIPAYDEGDGQGAGYDTSYNDGDYGTSEDAESAEQDDEE